MNFDSFLSYGFDPVDRGKPARITLYRNIARISKAAVRTLEWEQEDLIGFHFSEKDQAWYVSLMEGGFRLTSWGDGSLKFSSKPMLEKLFKYFGPDLDVIRLLVHTDPLVDEENGGVKYWRLYLK